MYITLEANYAVKIVEFLTRVQEKTDAKTIAAQSAVPLRFALKILRKLVSDEIVLSYKGAKGGYKIAKPAENITLKDVIESIEGPFLISRCQNENYDCGRANCNIHFIYQEISDEIREKLEKYNFADICKKPMCCGKENI